LPNLYEKLEAADENNKLLPSIVSMMESVQKLGEAASSIADAAQTGNLDYQADSSDYKGAYADVVENLNGALRAISAPLQEIKQVLSAMADGDLTMSMQGGYEGEYQEISQAIIEPFESMSAILTI
jgi:methyl-accepting chemotaxis protein